MFLYLVSGESTLERFDEELPNDVKTAPSSVSRNHNKTIRPCGVSARCLAARLKQITLGKDTPGYRNYRRQVSKCNRKSTDPQTPDAQRSYSKRTFDGLLKQWRRGLHVTSPLTDIPDSYTTSVQIRPDPPRATFSNALFPFPFSFSLFLFTFPSLSIDLIS